MRAIVILAVIAAIAAVAWIVFGGQEPATPEVTAPAAQATPEAAETETAVEETQDAVEDVADEATTAVEELQEQATEAIQDAEDRVNDAVEGALENVNEAVDDASDALESVVPDALDQETPQSETTGSLAEALSVEGFDAEVLRQSIADSDLGVVQSQLAEGLVVQAEENPELIQEVVDQLRELLGPG
ncbi:MAG: hypothetical protein HKN27_07515 [Silicimonas sp.]|nr:hypothetical protein [Silicimonas sp.]